MKHIYPVASRLVTGILILWVWLGVAVPGELRAQTYLLPATGNSTITTCSGTLYDNGGASGTYSANATGAVTITPATAGSKVKLQFTAFVVETGYDAVSIYDGTSVAAPLIGTYNSNNPPPTVYGSSTSGALTVRLTSDGIVNLSGFAATIECVTTVPAPVQADLLVQGATLSALSIAAGGALTANSSIYNQSGALANSSSVGYYLSSDATWDGTDQLLSYSQGFALAAWQSSYRYGYFSLPAGTAPGTYYVLFVADYLQQVPESNESNNVAAVSITVAPPGVDLVVQQEQMYPSATVAGNSLQLNAYMANQGNTTAGSSTMGFYLSTNQVLDGSDVLMGTSPGGTLPSNQSSYRYAYPTVPAGTAPGSYYVLFVADPANAVAETNEANNVRSLPLTLMAPSMDLVLQSTSLMPASVAAGGSTTATCYLYNQGNALANPATVGYFLSTNQVWDAGDVLLGNTTGSLVGAIPRCAT
ncbi:CARDB domain-containing protein [Hymenobacter humi]|uniref:CARDB domain-containing protein n=1 Tax=Hymenobacter humi TaxID=1411620 RepID=A0ABW2U1R7_9BACT